MRNKKGEIWCCEVKGQCRLVVIVANDDIVVDVEKIDSSTFEQDRRKSDVEIEQWLAAGLETP